MEDSILHSQKEEREQYVQVLLPLPLASEYTYVVPDVSKMKLSVGARVLVPFGKNKLHTGIVVSVSDVLSEGIDRQRLKEVTRLSDAAPVVLHSQLALWRWIAMYYLSPLGDVLRAALPNALRDEDAEVKYAPKTEAYLEAAFAVDDVKQLSYFEGLLKRSPRQMEVWSRFLCLALDEHGRCNSVLRSLVVADDGASAVVSALIKRGLLRIQNIVVSRIPLPDGMSKANEEKVKPLNQQQQQAMESIKEALIVHSSALLWGVTGSGKTEIYIHIANELMRQGKQVLYLVPEIALTAQLADRLRYPFGNNLAVYHSKLTDAERVEIWQQQLSDNPFPIVLGARSSVFLPFKNLGLVIIDEEHESSYKQQDPAPRYHARSVAQYLAYLTGAKTLLGSATPSLETYYNCISGKYGLVKLWSRHFDTNDVGALPIHRVVVDSRDALLDDDAQEYSRLLLLHTTELRRKRVMKTPFAPHLVEAIRYTLHHHKQVVVFQNRRGYAQYIECCDCGFIPRCPHCAVSLTYHRTASRKVRGEHLSCHYCGASFARPTQCPKCGTNRFSFGGTGTQQVQEQLEELFPDHTIERMDMDTTQRKNAVVEMVDRIQQGTSHILVGTQIVTKGFDFDRVTMVAILNADYLMNLPDFRAHERAFQLMKQVAGRAGRRGTAATIAIQTSDPLHPLFQYITGDDDEAFFRMQLHERSLFHYPPYTRLILINMCCTDEELLQQKAELLAQRLKTVFAERVLGPNSPPVNKISRQHIRRILLKIELSTSVENAKKHLSHIITVLQREDPNFRKVSVAFDVDPV